MHKIRELMLLFYLRLLRIPALVLLALCFTLSATAQETKAELAEQTLKKYEHYKNTDVYQSIDNLRKAIHHLSDFDIDKAETYSDTLSSIADTTNIAIIKATSIYAKGIIEMTRDIDKAIPLYEEAIDLLAPEHLDQISKNKENTKLQRVNTLRAAINRGIGLCYKRKRDYTKAIKYYQDFLAFSLATDAHKDVCSAHAYIAQCHELSLDYEQAIVFYKKAIECAEIKETRQTYLFQRDMANAYRYMGDRHTGLELKIISLKGAEKEGDLRNIALISGNLMQGLDEIGDYKNAIAHGKKAEKIYKKIGANALLSELYNNFSDGYLRKDSLEKAMEYSKMSLKICKEHKLYREECRCMVDMGAIYLAQANLKSAEEHIIRAGEIADEHQLGIYKQHTERMLGEIYLKQNRPQKAVNMLNIALKKFEKFGTEHAIIKIKKDLSDAYAATGNNKRALELLTECMVTKDSINDVSKVTKLAQLESNHQFEKEKEVLAMQKLKDEEVLVAKAAANRNLAGGIGALALLALGFFYNARQNNKKIAAKNKEILDQNSQLEQLNHTKDRIFAIIGHDLRKPVVAFNGISETINYLVQKEDYATLQQLGSEIEKDGFALRKLTDNLLNWALMQRDVMPHNPSKINLSKKAEEVILIFKNVAKDKNIKLVNTIPNGQIAFADSSALLTILVNLTDNALKYTPEGGRIEITAEDVNDGTQIKVSDTGIGMSKQQVQEVFLLQKNKSQKGTRGEQGTGLGMHLVNELVKLNGGKIVAESVIGNGTTFRFLLPAAKVAIA